MVEMNTIELESLQKVFTEYIEKIPINKINVEFKRHIAVTWSKEYNRYKSDLEFLEKCLKDTLDNEYNNLQNLSTCLLDISTKARNAEISLEKLQYILDSLIVMVDGLLV